MKFLRFLPLIGAVMLIGCNHVSSRPAAGPVCFSGWQLVYRHDPTGDPLEGSKSDLLAAIRSGAPIRFAWGFSLERGRNSLSAEHVAEPVFLTIVDQTEVVVQLPEHIAQSSYVDPSNSMFGDPAVMWRGLLSTTGTFDAVWVNRATGDEVRRYPQRAGVAWFALLGAAECRQDPLELALPGGVRRAGP
jgi:hypothetical protein